MIRGEFRPAAAGFTIMELAMVIVIVAVLAAFAASRINTASFTTEGTANEVAAAVRYAQKLAISQHRTVAVVVTPSNLQLCYTDTACSGGAVRKPPGTDAFTVGSSGVTLGGASFTFNALGKPSAGGTITVTGDGTKNVIIESETGYVRYVP
ncbi:MAG: GspH/FimT family pseudopilin [Pseudomonadota bacterium]